MLIFAVAESNVSKDGSFHLLNLFLEHTKVFLGNIKDISRIFVQFNRLCVCAFFEFELRLFLGSLDFSLNFVELRLELGLLLVVDSRLGALNRSLRRGCDRWSGLRKIVHFLFDFHLIANLIDRLVNALR